MSILTIKNVIESAVKSGRFGDNITFVDLVSTVEKSQDQFASDVLFAKVVLQDGTKEKVVSIVIKKQLDNPMVREMMNTDTQFYNEEVMYKEVLPLLEKNKVIKDTFPLLFHSFCTIGKEFEKDILVIEDLKPFGYILSKEKIFLDFDHVALALKKLGKFHALSYYSKKENPESFFKAVAKLKEATAVQNETEDNKRFLKISLTRGIHPLLEEEKISASSLRSFIKQIQDPFTLFLNLVKPEEPLAVICHGDFNRNNMLFKYDNVGKPVDVKFFDLATARYASPAIDLAFFLFMNTTTELRKTHWEDFFRIYHQALVEAVPGSQVPSLEEVQRDVEKKAAYGYFHCSFFIPMMMDNTPKCELEDFTSLPPEVLDEISRTKGGEPATKVLSDIVNDLIKFKSI